MVSKEFKKEAARRFQEQKSARGIYAVRSTTNGQAWVGGSKNLNATKNGCWFSLRNGSHRETSLQQAWKLSGEADFTFEILEEFDEDVHPLELDDLLKERKNKWVEQLKATPLL